VSISVFFPCYNEQENVGRTTEKGLVVLETLNTDFEVIIVNDGSSDDTGRIADEIAGRDNRVKVVHHEVNLGYGAALQMPPLLELTEQYDIVSCYRLNRQDPVVRKINGWCWTRLVCLLFGLKIRDIDCAFKLYKREIFDNIELSSTGALIDTEILARAKRKGYSIVQKGVHHYPRMAGEQSGASLRVILRAFKELFQLHRRIRSGN